MGRPNLLPTTGQLNEVKVKAEAMRSAYRNSCRVLIADETVTRSGNVAYFPYADHPYSLSTLLCACAGITIELAADGTPRDYINATYSCAEHGTHQSTAIRCADQITQHQTQSAFAWVEQRYARQRRSGRG